MPQARPRTRLRDRFGREVRNLRVSVTDRCNFRCRYCMPADGLDWIEDRRILRFEEIERLVGILAGLGVERVRLTGGEPLLRRSFPDLVARLARIDGLSDLALTTNGLLLAEQAPALRAAGLRRVNVSLDSLCPETFREIARRDGLEGVLRGLRAAAEHFEGPVKVNTVLLRGVNDHELLDFAGLAREHGFEVRFIEYMPLDADGRWSRDHLVPGQEVVDRIGRHWPLVPAPGASPHAPSRDWVFADGAPGKIGRIDSVTEPFCALCDRVRLTSDGKLRTCLFSSAETDLAGPIRDASLTPEAADRAVEAAVVRAVWSKEPGHGIGTDAFVAASRSMSQIGG